ncbi:hypothetical protein Syun_001551 [Stephania yunnanensis]|uniref:Uncharacterized protein n=1 Tax=Stephania yunnanensis TaxID=152371 RepID=A0AAP0LEB8_9MAGN
MEEEPKDGGRRTACVDDSENLQRVVDRRGDADTVLQQRGPSASEDGQQNVHRQQQVGEQQPTRAMTRARFQPRRQYSYK